MNLRKLATLSTMLVISAALVFATGQAEAKSVQWPAKTIKLIVPYSPGGDTDLSARVFAKHLTEVMGNPVVVVNMAGAAGSLGSRSVLDAEPDGYTVLYYHPSLFMNKLVGMTDYDHHDFEMVAVPAFADTDVLVVAKNSPYKSMKDLIDMARAKPETVKYAASLGAYSYIQAVALEDAAKVTFNKVDIGGAAEKLAAILGGHLDTSVFISNTMQDYVDNGELKILAQFGPKRSKFIPNDPTLIEQGINTSFEKFYFMAMPKGTPKAIVDKFASDVKKVVDSPVGQKDFDKLFITGRFIGTSEAAKYMDEQWTAYAKLAEMLK